jgi:flagellar export protein FliJ
MAVSRALRRLLGVRDLEEELSKIALESALAELHRLEHALTTAGEQGRRGRALVNASAGAGALLDRMAGIEETRSSIRLADVLKPRIADMRAKTGALREEFLMKRVERRQAETLIKETETRDALEARRRGQQALDDWYGNRLHRKSSGVEPEEET